MFLPLNPRGFKEPGCSSFSCNCWIIWIISMSRSRVPAPSPVLTVASMPAFQWRGSEGHPFAAKPDCPRPVLVLDGEAEQPLEHLALPLRKGAHHQLRLADARLFDACGRLPSGPLLPIAQMPIQYDQPEAKLRAPAPVSFGHPISRQPVQANCKLSERQDIAARADLPEM